MVTSMWSPVCRTHVLRCVLLGPNASLSEQEGPGPAQPALPFLPQPGLLRGKGWLGGGSLQEVEEQERRGWSGVEGLVPGARENGIFFRLSLSLL